MKQFFVDALDMFFDSGLYRTFIALLACVVVLGLLVVTTGTTLVMGIFGEVDWSAAAGLWAWPAFTWIPAVPIVAAFGMALWGPIDEGLWSRLADIMLTAFILAGGAVLIQAASVTMNHAAVVDPTYGMPLPGGLLLGVSIATAAGHFLRVCWQVYIYPRSVAGK